MQFPLLNELGRAASDYRNVVEGDVVTYRTGYYVEANGNQVTLFEPIVQHLNSLCVGVRTDVPPIWFTNRRETIDRELEKRQLFTCTAGDVLARLNCGNWSFHDPWRQKEVLAQWSELSKECHFKALSVDALSKAGQIICLSGGSATAKTYLSVQRGHLPPATSRGESEEERNGLRCARLEEGSVIAFGPLTLDSFLFYEQMFKHGELLCYFFSPDTQQWHWYFAAEVEEALNGLEPNRKLFFPGGLDMAELVKASFVCQNESLGRPTIIYNMPWDIANDYSTLEVWYDTRGTKPDQREVRLPYDKWSAEFSLPKADFVNVLVKGQSQSGFAPAIDKLVAVL